MAVREWDGEVIFLRRVVEQPASRSYGIEVARLAGLPETVVARARQILANLEMGELDEAGQARLRIVLMLRAVPDSSDFSRRRSGASSMN